MNTINKSAIKAAAQAAAKAEKAQATKAAQAAADIIRATMPAKGKAAEVKVFTAEEAQVAAKAAAAIEAKAAEVKAAQAKAAAVKVFTPEETQVITAAAMLEKSAENGRAQILELCLAKGFKADDLTKRGNKSAFEEIQLAIARGLLDQDELALWTDGKDAAAAKGASTIRNEITKRISKYIWNLQTGLKRANGEETKPKSKATSKDSAGEAETDSAGKPTNAISGVNPAESLESFLQGLNIMIMACNNSSDKKIHARKSTFIAVFQGMIGELNK
jgi:hypothetical protein